MKSCGPQPCRTGHGRSTSSRVMPVATPRSLVATSHSLCCLTLPCGPPNCKQVYAARNMRKPLHTMVVSCQSPLHARCGVSLPHVAHLTANECMQSPTCASHCVPQSHSFLLHHAGHRTTLACCHGLLAVVSHSPTYPPNRKRVYAVPNMCKPLRITVAFLPAASCLSPLHARSLPHHA